MMIVRLGSYFTSFHLETSPAVEDHPARLLVSGAPPTRSQRRVPPIHPCSTARPRTRHQRRNLRRRIYWQYTGTSSTLSVFCRNASQQELYFSDVFVGVLRDVRGSSTQPALTSWGRVSSTVTSKSTTCSARPAHTFLPGFVAMAYMYDVMVIANVGKNRGPQRRSSKWARSTVETAANVDYNQFSGRAQYIS